MNTFPVKKLLICGTDISAYTVICGRDADERVKKAVDTLTEMVKRAVGHRLPMAGEDEAAPYEIVVGVTDRDTEKVKEARASLKGEGYAIVAEDNRLFLTGYDDRGVIYGIYSFLEDYLGVRFYESGYTVIHEAQLVEVLAGTCVTFTPWFEYRDVGWYDYNKNHDFAARNKMNGALGAATDIPGASIYAERFVHTFSPLNDEPILFDSQPCLSDETVYQRMLSNARKWLEENPDSPIISISQNDSHKETLGCQCEKCRAVDEAEGTPMGSVLKFVNRMAEDLEKDYPNVVVDTLAYRYTRKPPKTIRPRENVAIRLCPIDYCFGHALDDMDCKGNIEFKELIESWAKVCKRLYIWDYVTDFAHYISPFPNFEVLWENVQFFKRNNVVGLFEEGNFESVSGEFGALRGYLLAKLLWNPDMTKEEYHALMDEFLQDYYGEGWRYIREYIDRTSEKAAQNHLHIYDTPDQYLPIRDAEGNMDLSFAREMTKLWEDALAAAATDVHRRHVRLSRLQDEYYNLFVNFDGQTERLEAFYRSLKEFGITHHREGKLLPELTDFTTEPKLW